MAARNDLASLYNLKSYDCHYGESDSQKNKIMPRLSNCHVDFKRTPARQVGEGFGGYLRPKRDIQEITVCDDQRVMNASLSKVNGRRDVIKGQKMNSVQPRDLLMYRTTERLRNIELENSRE
jgi:hypothetical protein